MKIRASIRAASKPHNHSDEYLAYLESDAWKATRQAALERAGHRCEHLEMRNVYLAGRCDVTTGLECHHLSYDRLGAEAWGDLVVLCHEHHKDADRRRQHARGRR